MLFRSDENWYAFWSPFRSELAANGFVSKLQESTGIDYRVVKVKTGVYEVAFADEGGFRVEDLVDKRYQPVSIFLVGGHCLIHAWQSGERLYR